MKTPFAFLSLLISFTVAATQPNPAVSWLRVYGGEFNDAAATSVVQLTDGSFAVGGYYGWANDWSSGLDPWVLHLDTNGDSTRSRRWEWYLPLLSKVFLCANDGGYVAAMTYLEYFDDLGNTITRLGLTRFDLSGSVVWLHSLFGSGPGRGDSVLATTIALNGLYAMAGSQTNFSPPNTDAYLVLTAGGQGPSFPVISRTYGGDGYDAFRSVASTSDGGFVLAGVTTSYGASMTDYYVVRTDSLGDTLWTRTYGGEGFDNAESVIATDDGSFAIIGYTSSFGTSGYDVYLVKTDGNGDTLWTSTYGGPSNQIAHGAEVTNNGDIVIAGMNDVAGTDSDSTLLMRVDPEGMLLWTVQYPGCSASSLDKTLDGGYVLGGYSCDLEHTELLVLKTGTDQTVSINDNFIPHPSSFSLSSYPNPFNPSTTLSFSLPQPQDVRLAVYDVTGREVRVVTEGRYEAGDHRTVFDGSELPSGIYFAHLSAGSRSMTQKLLLLK